MRLLFKQRFFSWFDSYDVYDEEGNASTEFVPTTIYDETETEYYLDDSVLHAGSYIIYSEACRQQNRISYRRI